MVFGRHISRSKTANLFAVYLTIKFDSKQAKEFFLTIFPGPNGNEIFRNITGKSRVTALDYCYYVDVRLGAYQNKNCNLAGKIQHLEFDRFSRENTFVNF